MFASLIGALRQSAHHGQLAPLAAARDYYTRPSMRQSWGGPLNGQTFRRRIIETLVSDLGVTRIIETGTYRGTTTELFGSLAEVWSIEANRRSHWYCRYRFRGTPSVHLLHGDSRSRLRELATRPELTAAPTLFYLDAHWGEDLPLAEELQIAAREWRDWVAVIDDFQVPGDDGYRFDSYSADATLNADYLARFGPVDFRLWYPTEPSDRETGNRRGCAVVTTVPRVGERLDALAELLRPA